MKRNTGQTLQADFALAYWAPFSGTRAAPRTTVHVDNNPTFAEIDPPAVGPIFADPCCGALATDGWTTLTYLDSADFEAFTLIKAS